MRNPCAGVRAIVHLPWDLRPPLVLVHPLTSHFKIEGAYQVAFSLIFCIHSTPLKDVWHVFLVAGMF